MAGVVAYSSNATKRTMQVTLSVGGKFHAFDLARELERRCHLQTLITSYPKYLPVRYGIRGEHIRSFPAKEVLQRSWALLPAWVRGSVNPYPFLHEVFDRAASGYIEPCDIFVGFSSFALHSMRRAHSLGAKTIIERGGSHIEYQRDILRDECAAHDVFFSTNIPHSKIIAKELSEYKEADYISVPSLFARQSFISASIPREKLIHIPYGVNLSLFNPRRKRDDIFRVIFAGGLILRKGVHYLLQAFAELHLPNAELHVIGPASEPMKPFLKKYEGHYRRSDYFSMGTLADVYSQGSVFVLPSIEDGFGLVIAQAMACGIPVIATDHTGAPDIVREGIDGFIIPIRDVEALKEKILYLYENPDIREQMGKNAQERVASGFTWDDYGDRIVKEYERILAVKI